MDSNIVIEDLGGAEDGVFLGWLKNAGDQVSAGEAIAEVMTDKVNTEIQSPATGILDPQEIEEEETVTLGQTIGTIKGTN